MWNGAEVVVNMAHEIIVIGLYEGHADKLAVSPRLIRII
jgi:hypothetical protein